MWNEDGSVAVIFNGEIYNHRQLRTLLVERGHVFRSDHSDTEVLVHGYEEWGEGVASRLNGMFALAVWDRRRRSIFLARDRFGEKPLFWYQDDDLFIFASELSAMSGHRQFRAEVDQRSLMKFLGYGFIPAPNAFFKRARKLPGGHWLRYRLEDQHVTTRPYWTFRIEPPDTPVDEDEAAEELREHLLRATERRLMSDVSLGVFLSGGIDSSAVTAAAVALKGGSEVKTFAIGFAESSYDESAFAKRVSTFLGTDHHEEKLTMDVAQGLIGDVLSRLDEPMGDASILPTYLLCRFARTKVAVALSGDGGDELFAGYDTFAALRMARLYRACIPAIAHRGLRRMSELLPRSGRNMSFDFKLRRALAGLGHPAEYWNPLWLAPLDQEALGSLLNERIEIEDLYSEAVDLWNGATATNLLDRTMEFYTRLYLQDGILVKSDRASMMNGLESRAVFLDNDLVDFARRLPAGLKMKRGVRKYLLKKAMRGMLPDDIIDRRKKGFGIPLYDWLRRLPYPGDHGFGLRLETGMARRCHREHRDGAHDHRLFLWCWTVLQQNWTSKAALIDG